MEYRPLDIPLLSGPLPEGQEVKDRQDPSGPVSSQDHFALPQAQSCYSSASTNQRFPTRTFPIATIIYDNAVQGKWLWSDTVRKHSTYNILKLDREHLNIPYRIQRQTEKKEG